ncbi:MAG: hypothetical protein ACXVAU_18695, partial [Mucilaginibacter sp.]
KQIWCNYFAVFGIGHDMAFHLMPLVGTMDILMGISLLFYPTRAVLLWLVIWGSITAMCRPMSGEPFAEMVERAGNFGAPLALLILSDNPGKQIKGWFSVITPDTFTYEKKLAKTAASLRIVAFLLLAGHGWLNLTEKKALVEQYASFGFSNPLQVAHQIGIFEMLAAASILIKPILPVLIVLLVWKMGSELFYPHWELFEWVERGGSYGVLLALLLTLPGASLQSHNSILTNNQNHQPTNQS